MKVKLPVYVAVMISMLISIIALPVMAEEDVPMWVSRARLAYVGRSSGGPDAVVGLIHIRDANLSTVAGATVTVEWTLPDGTVCQEAAVTAFQGIAEFSVWEGRGEYELCVIDVTKEGWVYDPDRDRDSCPIFQVP